MIALVKGRAKPEKWGEAASESENSDPVIAVVQSEEQKQRRKPEKRLRQTEYRYHTSRRRFKADLKIANLANHGKDSQ